MRILHFIPSIDAATGGPVEGLKQRCAIYRNSGHEVEVASLDSLSLCGSTIFRPRWLGWGRAGELTATRAMRCRG